VKTALALLLLTSFAHAKPTIQTVDERLANGVHVIVAPDATVNSIGVFVRHDDCAAALAAPASVDDELDRIDGFATSSLEPSHFDAYTQVPAGGLELALWFEAQRMAKPVLAPPSGLADDEYSMIDSAIEGALRAHVPIAKDEARRCVAPERTTVAIVGHIDAKSALAMARKFFSTFTRSRIAARSWRSTFSSSQTIKLHGSEAREVAAWAIPRSSTATAMIASAKLAKAGFETEVRDEQFRIIGDVTRRPERLAGDTTFEKRVVETQLLQKLESLRYRASVLASGANIDALRADIAKVDDLDAFAQFLENAPSLTVEVAP
jgi:hypothetical protein